MKEYLCPVCGFDHLKENPYDQNHGASYEICPCCGFEFGFDGDNNEKSFSDYRQRWIADGSPWFTQNLRPKNWDCKLQLKNLKKYS